jgi:hypothetical protein
MVFDAVVPKDVEFPVCDRTRRRKGSVPTRREFVMWDGEGATKAGCDRQDYILLGYYNGVDHRKLFTGKPLTTKQCLEFIADAGDDNPHTYHVSFAFGYDVNMILRDLSPQQFAYLHKTSHLSVYGYNIEHIPGKWLQVTRLETSFQPKITVKIQDIFGFYQCSLIKALEDNIPDHPLMRKHLDEIKVGKSARDTFDYDNLNYIVKYWEIENVLAHALINHLREMMYDDRVKLYITRWFGPGAVASYGFKKYEIDNARRVLPASIYTAAQYAYTAGRFELYQVGRFQKVWGIDLNSAYPAAMAQLPDLTEGYWQMKMKPTEIVEFGVYYVKMNTGPMHKILKPGPLFHRDKRSMLSFPWVTEGWYWAPEVKEALSLNIPGLEIKVVKGYEYVGWTSRPYSFIPEVFDQRARLKAAKDGAQYPLKVFLNSLYGKTAQRVGWERTGGPPRWHQLEWAGWITSQTRARMYSILKQIPPEHLISIETDGIYTTYDPALLGIEDSRKLGEWEVSTYESAIYLQSGVYALEESPGQWKTKYRGLDKGSITAEMMLEHTQAMAPNIDLWPNLVGPSTRFTGYGQALMLDRNDDALFKRIHAHWVHSTKEIKIGSVGKRVHNRKLCIACRRGDTAFETPHTLFINSAAHSDPVSFPHHIPWADEESEETINKLEYEAEEHYAY